MLVLGDLGVGKTTLCRTLLDLQERKSRAALVGNALLSPDDLLRLMLQDLGAVSKEEVHAGARCRTPIARAAARDVRSSFSAACKRTERRRGADRRRSAQPAAGDEGAGDRDRVARVESRSRAAVPAGRPAGARRRADVAVAAPTIASSVRARLLPLERDECERYVIHRLAIAGGNAVTFSTRGHRGDLHAVRRRAAAGQPAVRARAAGSRRRARPIASSRR